MPTYSYACTECDNKFDMVQSFDEDSLTQCPSCQGRLRKLFNSVGIVFKGSGFYRTDSRSGSSSVAAGGESSSSAKSESAKSAKSESGGSGSGASSSKASSSSAASTSSAPAAS